MIKKIVSFFRGYLQVKIEGNALERFISQITNADIYLWDIKRIAKDHYRAKMYAEDFNRLRPLVKKRLCRVKILKKIGWHFLLVNMRKRLYLVIGLIIFISIIWVASSFLWFINIQGIDKINREEIVNILNENGVRPGVLKKSVDLEACERLCGSRNRVLSGLTLVGKVPG